MPGRVAVILLQVREQLFHRAALAGAVAELVRYAVQKGWLQDG